MNGTATLSTSTPTPTHAAPSISDWRGVGHRFDDIPESIRGYVRQELSIPALHRTILLPEDRLSVLDLISTSLPPITCSQTIDNTISIDDLFSIDSPPNDIELLSRALVPPRKLVAELLSFAKQKFLDGFNSIRTVDGTFPLYTIQLWSEIYLTIEPTRLAWKNAIDWLISPHHIRSLPQDVHDTLQSLAHLPWPNHGCCNILKLSKNTLARFLSRDWLGDEQIDLLIALLRQDIQASLSSRNIHLIDCIFSRQLLHAFHDDITGVLPYDPCSDGFVQRFGPSLTSTSEFGGIFHINGNHWIAAAVDIAQEALVYADPAGGPPDDDVVLALHWFVSKHIPGFNQDTVDFELMPCTSQDVSYDAWNCGIFSYNALGHFYLKDQSPLLGSTHGDTDRFRMAIVRQLVAMITADEAFIPAIPLTRFIHPSFPPSSSKPTKKSIASNARELPTAALPPAKSLKPKKRKSVPSTPSVIAPVFQIKPLKSVEELKRRSKAQKMDDVDDAASVIHQDLSEASSDDDTATAGRPRLEELDLLTVELRSERGKPRKYRCAGKGCPKTWAPRARARVLRHCKACLKMTKEQRRIAAMASAEHAPGALVAQDASTSAPPSSPSSESFVTFTSKQSKAHGHAIAIRASQPPSDTFFGPRGRKETHRALDFAIVKLFCAAAIPLHIADLLPQSPRR
ncbi:hypothetical protein H0H92_008501 [Tricholoma furcatifolium]|nr:hypothetical protein H0H92_008501 [Tricholoma furcatifolium]